LSHNLTDVNYNALCRSRLDWPFGWNAVLVYWERRKCHPKQRGIALLQPTFHFVYLLDADCHYLYVYAQYALPFPVELVAKKKYNDNLFTF
jgi:hypothetical protein